MMALNVIYYIKKCIHQLILIFLQNKTIFTLSLHLLLGIYLKKILMVAQLLYNIVFISAAQQSESDKYMYLLFFDFFHLLPQSYEQSSLCYLGRFSLVICFTQSISGDISNAPPNSTPFSSPSVFFVFLYVCISISAL